MCVCVSVLHINRSGLNHTQLSTRGCQCDKWSQRSTNANGPHHGGSTPLKPTGIIIATKPSLPSPTTRKHGGVVPVKTMSLGTNYSFYCPECCQHFRILIISCREDCLMCCSSPKKVTKSGSKPFPSYRSVTRGQVMEHLTSNGTDQCQNGSPKPLIPYREQLRSTRVVLAYPRPALSAMKRTNRTSILFD